MTTSLPANFAQFIAGWSGTQTNLKGVIRFGKYVDTEKYPNADPKLRKQNTLEHVMGFLDLTVKSLPILKAYNPGLDGEIVLCCVQQHDHPEGHEVTSTSSPKNDTMYINKTLAKDVVEYVIYCSQIANYHPVVQGELKRVYLLQCAFKDENAFPEDARIIILELRKNRPLEARVFDALERFDYVLYAAEGWHEHGNRVIMTQVLRNQISHLDRHARELPGFNLIWTDELSAWSKAFIEANADVEEERKKVA